jgi:hypothetical protein
VWVDSISSNALITPADISRPENFPWVAVFEKRLLEDVKDNERFDKKARQALIGSAPFVHADSGSIFDYGQMEENDSKIAYLLKIHDKKSQKYYIFSESSLLFEENDSLQVDGKLPFEFITLNEDSDNFWGISIGQMIESAQEEINLTKRILYQLRKNNLLKFLYLKNAFKESSLNRLLSMDIEDIGIGVPVDGEHIEAIQQAFYILESTPNTIGMSRDMQFLETEAGAGVNLGVNQTGSYSGKHNVSAQEASIVNRYNELGAAAYKSIVADVISKILERYSTYIFRYWQGSKTTMLDNQPQEYKGHELMGDYDISVDVADYEPVNNEQRKTDMLQLAQVLLQDPMFNSNPQVAFTFRKYLMEQFGWTLPEVTNLFPAASNVPQEVQTASPEAITPQMMEGI